jgi:hypothetical protein
MHCGVLYRPLYLTDRTNSWWYGGVGLKIMPAISKSNDCIYPCDRWISDGYHVFLYRDYSFEEIDSETAVHVKRSMRLWDTKVTTVHDGSLSTSTTTPVNHESCSNEAGVDPESGEGGGGRACAGRLTNSNKVYCSLKILHIHHSRLQ